MGMKNVCLVLILWLLHAIVIGQPTVINDLTSKYYSDTNDMVKLEAIINYYASKNLDSLNYYADIYLSIADKELKDKIYIKKSNAYILFNDFNTAEKLIKLIKINNQSAPQLHIEYLLVIGRILRNEKKHDEALQNFYNALQLIKDNSLNHLLPEVYSAIASILRENNDLENCTKYYRYALAEAKVLHKIELQVNICHALCRIYNGGIIVNLDSSVYYGELGLEISREEDYELGYATMIKVVAAPLIRQGQYRKGLKMSQEALLYSEKYNFSIRAQYYLINNQGFAYEKLGLYDSALIKKNEGVKIYSKGIDHHRLEYLIFKSKGDNLKALKAFEVYKYKHDSIIKGRNKTKLSLLQARLEADIKEAEVASLIQTSELQAYQLSQQKYFLGGLFAMILLIVAAAIMVYRQRQLKQQQEIINLELDETRKRLNIEKQYRASELKALRSQMNPHFIFNALNSIQEYIVSNEKKQAGKYLGKFADLMRMYLYHSQTKTITLREEIEALNLYLELEKLRFEDSLSYTLIIDENVDSDHTPIPSLIVQPYVENAIKHGLLHKKHNRKLSISFHVQQSAQVLECIIVDNGIGRKRSEEINKMRNPEHKSFAINATKTRLELLNYNSDTSIGEKIEDLFDENGDSIGTKVVLSIPIIRIDDLGS